MTNHNQTKENSVVDWFASPIGEALIDCGINCFRRLLPEQYYRVAIQVAGSPGFPYLEGVQSEIKYAVMNSIDSATENCIVAESGWLPFAARSIDLLVLPHVLEFSPEPHDVLRELSECVAPEGIVAIIGLNSRSMLGILKSLGSYSETTLQSAKLYSVVRIRDWLSLLGFETIAGEFTYFRPPISQKNRFNRLKYLETAGTRWWPGIGSVFVLIACRKELGIHVEAMKTGNSRRRYRKAVLAPLAERNRFSNMGNLID